MKPTTIDWVRKAEGDFDGVCTLRKSRKRSRYDTICYLCQQCAEKYLKARMTEGGVRFDKTHDLVKLLQGCANLEPLWLGLELELRDLSYNAVEVRYPGKFSGNTDAKAAYATCRRLRELARASLGLKP